jgi:hypothetical protein
MRTDKQVQEDVIAELSWEPVKSDIEAALKRRAAADAQKISAEVRGGDVTLTGAVHSRSVRDLARDSAWGPPVFTTWWTK